MAYISNKLSKVHPFPVENYYYLLLLLLLLLFDLLLKMIT